MKMSLLITTSLLLLIAASSDCFAIQEIEDVSKERAKELGVTLRSNENGQSGVEVRLEFRAQGVLKNFSHVELEINEGPKRLVEAPLLTSPLVEGRLAVRFSTDSACLSKSVLTIVVQDGPRSQLGYRLKVKDFIEDKDLNRESISNRDRGPWPHVEYAEVRAYYYDPTPNTDLLINGKLNQTVANPKGVLLNPDQIQRFIKAVDSSVYYRSARSYNPRHGFVFYNERKNPVAWVEINLACMNGKVYPPAIGSINYPAVAELLEELKLPLGPHVADVENYRKERQTWRLHSSGTLK